MKKHAFGTREWAEKTKNLFLGCSNDCKYCYAKADAVRFKRCTPDDWSAEVLNEKAFGVSIHPKAHSLMFPSTHDITPANLNASVHYLARLLRAYPSVLVVTKPHKKCIRFMCRCLRGYQDKLTFRFTIGSADNKVLRFWEPNASHMQERVDCLQLAHKQGYRTSVSCEPMLDNHVEDVVRFVRPFVTDTIWIGKANKLKARLRLNGYDNPETMAKANQLLEWQSDENIIDLYQRLKDEPLIRWKESIRTIVGTESSPCGQEEA